MDKPHKKLNVWQYAMDLAVDLYRVTGEFPREEMYGLSSQIRRAAVSIVSNIAEGAARQTKKEFANFLHMARGSLSELDTQLDLASRLQYIKSGELNHLDKRLSQIDKMIAGLIRRQKPPYTSLLTPHQGAQGVQAP